MSSIPENSPAPVSGRLNSGIPLPSARDLWPAWTAVGLLFAAVSFLVYFRYHSIVGSLIPLHRVQDNVLLFAVPCSLALISGMALAFRPQMSMRTRFWTAAACCLVIASTALVRHPSFVPIYVGDWGIMPNFAGLGIAAVTAFAGAELSVVVERGLRGEFPRRMLLSEIVGSALVIVAVSAYFITPYISIEQRQAPAVLNENYRLVWEKSFPLKEASLAAGFWFRSSGSGLPLDEDAVFLRESWIGRINLRDGGVVWGKDFDFGQVINEIAAFAVYFDDDRLYVANRSRGWTVFAFDWADGRLLWRAAEGSGQRTNPDNPRLTLNVTPEFIVMTAEDGKLEYDIIDPETGAATRRSLPVPTGMVLASGPPILLEGTDGTAAILAYLAPAGSIAPEEAFTGEPPDKGYLFGLDPATGEVAWRIEGAGDWMTEGWGSGRNLWVTSDLVIHHASYPPFVIKAWDTTSGRLIWSREFAETATFVLSPLGAVARHDEQVLECFDVLTGERRWRLDDTDQRRGGISIRGETLLTTTSESIIGRRMSDGSELFRVDAKDGAKLGEHTISGGILKVGNSRFIDLATGSEVAAEPYRFSPTRGISEGYLFALRPGDIPGRPRTLSGIVPVFKVQGYASHLPIEYGTKEPPTERAAGGFMVEGWVLLSSWDYSAGVFHMYMIGPAELSLMVRSP